MEEKTTTISQFFSKKQACKSEEQENKKTPIKEEPEEYIAPNIEKEEPQNRLISKTTTLKDEASVMEEPKKDERVESTEQKSVKEEPHSQEESLKQIDESDTKNTDNVKPLAKEKLHISPVKKRRKGAIDKQPRKGADDKQPTLFSYFGKN